MKIKLLGTTENCYSWIARIELDGNDAITIEHSDIKGKTTVGKALAHTGARVRETYELEGDQERAPKEKELQEIQDKEDEYTKLWNAYRKLNEELEKYKYLCRDLQTELNEHVCYSPSLTHVYEAISQNIFGESITKLYKDAETAFKHAGSGSVKRIEVISE